jgi:hypothetical protein
MVCEQKHITVEIIEQNSEQNFEILMKCVRIKIIVI